MYNIDFYQKQILILSHLIAERQNSDKNIYSNCLLIHSNNVDSLQASLYYDVIESNDLKHYKLY